MYQTGEYVFDKAAGSSVQVLERIEVWGYVSYKVYDAASGRVYKAPETQLERKSAVNHLDDNYLRYLVLLSKIKNETAGGFLTSLSSGIIPLPHQTHVLNRAMSNNTIRYILADEVGLGKTIEAGLIIKELKARGLIERVLVVCPTGLVTQWASEMQEKFHERFQVILPSDYDTIRRLTDQDDVYGQYDQVISPMDSIKPLDQHAGWTDERVEQYNQERIYSIINSGWDLIIIDEAHRVAGSTSEVARYKLGYLLSQASPYLLLLTATPHNGKTEPFLRLVRLLDENAFPNYKSIVKEQVAPYLIRTEKREAIDNNGNLLFKKRYTHLIELHWEERHSLQRDVYEMVSDYVANFFNMAVKNRNKNMCIIFLLIIMQRMVTSSTAAVKRSLERRLATLENRQLAAGNLKEEDLDELDIEDNVQEALESLSLDLDAEKQLVAVILEAAKQAELQYNDVKAEYLITLLDRLLSEEPDQKIIVFTEFVDTQTYLQKLLVRKGYTVSVLNGRMSMEERDAALREFRNETSIFISTDAGGEGLNLQFSHIIINYDLPWNPMKIEQRCGRADRIGQKNDVHIYNFILADTVESRVREVLEDKLSVILSELGIDKYSDVLDSETAEINYTEAYMRSICHPDKIEQNIYPVEKEMQQQAANAYKYRELIHEEKDLNALVGQGPSFDVESALYRMLNYYDAWKGYPPHRLDRININDEEIVRHLNKEFQYDKSETPLGIRIKNFKYETGYYMLWQLTVSDDESTRKIIPVFISEKMVYRPFAGRKITDAILNDTTQLEIIPSEPLSEDVYQQLEEMSLDAAYDTFAEMRDQYLKKAEESHRKYIYALKLREEAAQLIGIENIRQARLARIEKEKQELDASYEKRKSIYPDFRMISLIRLEE